MAANMELQLLLKLNDQMSRGLKAALESAQKEQKAVAHASDDIANATNRIKTSPIERMTQALRSMRTAGQETLNTLQRISQAGAAAAAGGYVLASAAKRPMAYDRQLAIMANTAYSDRDVTGRIAGKAEMDRAIRASVRGGGGSPEQAAETLNTLIGSGALGDGKAGIDASMRLLPVLQKFATGTGADPNLLANIVIAAKQNMNIAEKDMPAVLSKAIRAGQEGGFELTDMAKWLPQQMALASQNGMRGMGGLETLLAANQVSRITAGTSDEAGNNLVNLLAKINSQDTANDFKKQGIDLSGRLAAARGKGVGALDAFVSLVDHVGGQDKRYKSLRERAAGETGAEQKATYGAMADIMMQSGIGKVVQDRQTMMALIAMIMQKEKYQDVKNKVHGELGAEGEKSFGTVASTVDYKAEQVGNDKAFAAMDTLNSIAGPLGKMLDGVNEVATANPKLAAATYAATTALTAFTAAAGVSALLQGGKDAGILTRLAKSGGGLVSRLGGRALGWLAGGIGGAGIGGTLSSLAIAGGAGYAVGTGLNWGMNKLTSMATDGKESSVAELIYDLLHKNDAASQPIKVTVDVKNGNIVASVNEANSRTASRH